jgi:hypothetical protein
MSNNYKRLIGLIISNRGSTQLRLVDGVSYQLSPACFSNNLVGTKISKGYKSPTALLYQIVKILISKNKREVTKHAVATASSTTLHNYFVTFVHVLVCKWTFLPYLMHIVDAFKHLRKPSIHVICQDPSCVFCIGCAQVVLSNSAIITLQNMHIQSIVEDLAMHM